MADLVLPAFEMDCRDWIVTSPDLTGSDEDASGAPLLAVLTTMVVSDDIHEATGSLSVGIIEDEDDIEVRAVSPGSAACELLEFDTEPGTRRFVMRAPGQHLALLAEFRVAERSQDELVRRVEALMTSFRWQAA